MKILYITVSMPYWRGEEFFIPEVIELIQKGHGVLIVPRAPLRTIVNTDAKRLRGNSIRRHLLSPAVLLVAVLECFFHPMRAISSFALLFKDNRLRILFRNIVVFPKALWLASVARKWQAEHIHAQWGLTTATMAMVASEMTGIPWSFTAHRGDIADSNLLVTKSERASFVRFISQSGRCMAEELGALRNARRHSVIHMGVALPTQPVLQKRTDRRFIVLCPANLYPVKGHKYLIEAMSILQKSGVACTLHLAGSGELLKELQEQVDLLGVNNNVSFLGHVPHEHLLQLYSESRVDAVVLPSVDLGNHLHEGIPVCLMEAMSYGVPVISTATGAIPELLHEGAGIIVPQQNSAALADAVERLIREPELRARLGISGRRRIEAQFAVERTVAELIVTIEESSVHVNEKS
jgi:colanic acid/amylovoran biosynthesis glycosyltransferase